MRPKPLSPTSAACTEAVLALLGDGQPRTTGRIEQATGFEQRFGQLVYLTLTRLQRRGLVGRTHRGTWLRSIEWRWWPDEGNCDRTPVRPPADYCPPGCLRPEGCLNCRFWALRNLGRPL